MTSLGHVEVKFRLNTYVAWPKKTIVFYTYFGQPDMSTPDQALPWPENLTRNQLKDTYAKAYVILESEFPDILDLENCDYPHPAAFDSSTEGSDGSDSDIVAVIPRDPPRDSTTLDTVDSAPEVPEEPVGLDPIGPVMGPDYPRYIRPRSGYRSPTWPPFPLWQWASGRPLQEVRPIWPGPIPNPRFNPAPNDRLNPMPSTSSGVTSPLWQGSELGLVPMNQEARKLFQQGFLTEVTIGKILADKAENVGNDPRMADVFNRALTDQIGRRARFLETYKCQQTRYESYARRLQQYGTPIPNQNPGYSGREAPSGEIEETILRTIPMKSRLSAQICPIQGNVHLKIAFAMVNIVCGRTPIIQIESVYFE
jgi:hypothetical protein